MSWLRRWASSVMLSLFFFVLNQNVGGFVGRSGRQIFRTLGTLVVFQRRSCWKFQLLLGLERARCCEHLQLPGIQQKGVSFEVSDLKTIPSKWCGWTTVKLHETKLRLSTVFFVILNIKFQQLLGLECTRYCEHFHLPGVQEEGVSFEVSDLKTIPSKWCGWTTVKLHETKLRLSTVFCRFPSEELSTFVAHLSSSTQRGQRHLLYRRNLALLRGG